MPKFPFRREELPATELTLSEIETYIKKDSDRRVKFLKRKKILRDELKSIVDSELSLMFSRETYEDMRLYIDVSNNLMRRVIREISTLYSDEHERTVTPKSNQKIYEEIIGDEGISLNDKLRRSNYLLNGLNDLVFQVAVPADYIDINCLTPDKVIVIENQDNPVIVDALLIEDCYTDRFGRETKQYIFWSPTRHFIIDENFRAKTVDGNDQMINPYREINIQTGEFHPFVFAHNSDREESFWDTYSGDDLVEATKLIAIKNTFLYFMFPMQFKQIAIQMNTDDGVSIKSNQIKSPLHVMTTNGAMQTLDWQSNLQQLSQTIQDKLFMVAGNYGISSENFKLMATATSGFARMVAKERLNEIRKEQIPNWRKIESGLFGAIRAGVNLYGIKRPIADTAKFSIDYKEPEFVNDPASDLDVKERKIELGILNPLDLIKEENPDIKTDEEAEEVLNSNIQIKNRIKSRFGFSGGLNLGLNNDQQNKNIESAQRR